MTCRGVFAPKKSELIEIKSYSSELKTENEKLKIKVKTMSQFAKTKENEVKELKFKNENLEENLEAAKNETLTITKEKRESEREKIKLEKQIKKATKTIPTSTKSTNTFINLSSASTNTPSSLFSSMSPTNSSSTLETSTSLENEIKIKDPKQNAVESNNNNPDKDNKVEALKLKKIDHHNYEEALREFLEQFKETTCETPKYRIVATQMMNHDYNMFHLHLKDIRKFNPNLGGFMNSQYRNLEPEITKIIQKYIENLKLGSLQHGLYFCLNRSK